jgi:hypothetical protein
MSEYYLADLRAQERERQRELQREREKKDHSDRDQPKQAQDVKITLLGDFLIASHETQGFDPYNASEGKSAREAWKMRRDRR